MKVLVTGASGKLGSKVARLLEEEGHDVVATDRVDDDAPGRVHRVDLVDADALSALVEGVSGVVHCAAISRRTGGSPREILDANVQGTLNLLQACLARGVRRFVFASTIQVQASEGTPEDEPPQVAYLPLDGDSPANPTNLYAFSKAAGEALLRTLFVGEGRQCQSLRFPWLTDAAPDGHWGRRLNPPGARESRVLVEQGFSFLSFGDAARLIHACLETALPGHRVYLPALCAIPPGEIGDYVARYYPHVPLKRPLSALDSLVDIDVIQAETGWTPRDHPPAPEPVPRVGWLHRILGRG